MQFAVLAVDVPAKAKCRLIFGPSSNSGPGTQPIGYKIHGPAESRVWIGLEFLLKSV